MNRFLRFFNVVILLSMITLVANAQFSWGLETGSSSSTQSDLGNIYNNGDITTSLNLGLMAYYGINDWFAIKSGLSYAGKGRKFDGDNSTSAVTTNLRYLSLPLKTEFSAGKQVGFKNGQEIFSATGPYFGYLVNAIQNINGNKQAVNANDFKNTDFGWSFEVGMKFPVFEKNDLFLSVNYDMGLSKISKSDESLRNKTASLNLGFQF